MLLEVVFATGFFHTIPGLDLKLQEQGLDKDLYKKINVIRNETFFSLLI